MPNNGLIFETGAIEFRLQSTLNSASGTGVGTLAKSHIAHAETSWVPNSINVNQGIYLEVSSSDDGAGTTVWQAKYDGPGAPFGGYVVGAGAFRNTVSITARVINLKIYCKLTGSLLRTVFDSVMIFVNGALSVTLTGAFDYVSNGVGANYVNIFGIPLYATGSCSASKVYTPPVYDPCNPSALSYDYSSTATSTVEAGWRFQDENNNWVTLDCDIWSHSIPTGAGCPFNLSFNNEVTVSDTNSIEIHCRSYGRTRVTYDGRRALNQRTLIECCDIDGNCTTVYDAIDVAECANPCGGGNVAGFIDAYYTENWSESHGGYARAIPNLERSIVRLNNDYKALWRRFHFPEVRGSATRNCVNGAVTVNTGGAVTVYNDLGVDFLELVTNATSNVEQCFPANIYTQYGMNKNQAYSKTWSYNSGTVACLCPPSSVPIPSCPPGTLQVITCTIIPYTDPNTTQSEGIDISFPSYVGTLSTYQGHADMLCRYTGSWVNPHWALAYHKQNWDVDGSPADANLYWETIKEQYLYNASLPISPRTRNSMIASPMYWDNGNQPFQDAFFNEFRWIGVSRFKTLSTTLPNSVTLSTTRTGSWSSTDCSFSIGASGITVSGFTKPTAILSLDLCDYATDPYLLLMKTHQAILSWNVANVSNIDIALIGLDGVSNYIGNVAGTYDFNVGIQNKYAGSWAIDNGAGLVSDTGTDSLPNGISSTVMSNPETVVGFELAKGRQYARLEFRITPTNMANSVLINFPTFNLEHTHPMNYWENSKCLSMLWHNRMVIRWGQQRWYDPILGFQNPPLVDGMGTASTIIDAMAFRYRILLGTGGTNLANTITTDLSSMYDTYEGQSISVVDKFSCSFVLPKGQGQDIRFALVNSFSELPPFACFPYKKRSTQTWLPTGSYAQVVYDWVQDGRYLISNESASAKLQTDAGVDSGSALSPQEPGWYIWTFNPTLYNNEVDWKIVSGGKTFALVRPWHGWFCLLRATNCRTSMDIDFASNVHVSAFVLTNGDVQIRLSDNGLVWVTVNTLSINASSVAIRIDRQSTDQKIYLLVEVNGQIKLYTSNQAGETFTLARTIGSGVKPAFIIGRDGTRFIYWVDGVSIKGQMTDRADTILQVSGMDTFTVINTGVDDECIAVDEDVYNGGNRRLVLIDVESANLVERKSDDGITFS